MFARRAATQLRSSVPRQFGRRQLSTESGLHGAADNAFNRERAAVKDHAAATSGTERNTTETKCICSERELKFADE